MIGRSVGRCYAHLRGPESRESELRFFCVREPAQFIEPVSSQYDRQTNNR